MGCVRCNHLSFGRDVLVCPGLLDFPDVARPHVFTGLILHLLEHLGLIEVFIYLLLLIQLARVVGYHGYSKPRQRSLKCPDGQGPLDHIMTKVVEGPLAWCKTVNVSGYLSL